MANPSFHAAGTGVFCANSVADPSTLAATAPAGRSAGDVLFCATWCRSITATVSTPSGWNLASGFPKRQSTASGGSCYVFTRIADGTSADNCSPSWSGVTTGTSGDSSGAVILAYSGLTETQDASAVTVNGASTSTTSPLSITTGTNNSMVIVFAWKIIESAGQTSSVSGNGFTERYDNATTSGSGHIEEVCDVALTGVSSAGASGGTTITWTATTSARASAVTTAWKSIMPTAASALDSVLTFVTAGFKSTFGASAIAETVTFVTSGIRSTFGASSVQETLTFTTAGTRTVYGASAMTSTFTATTAGTRETFGASDFALTDTLTTGGFVGHFGASEMALTDTLTTGGVRTTFGASSLSETLTLTSGGVVGEFGSSSLELAFTLTTAGEVTSGVGPPTAGTITHTATGDLTHALTGRVTETRRGRITGSRNGTLTKASHG